MQMLGCRAGAHLEIPLGLMHMYTLSKMVFQPSLKLSAPMTFIFAGTTNIWQWILCWVTSYVMVFMTFHSGYRRICSRQQKVLGRSRNISKVTRVPGSQTSMDRHVIVSPDKWTVMTYINRHGSQSAALWKPMENICWRSAFKISYKLIPVPDTFWGDYCNEQRWCDSVFIV